MSVAQQISLLRQALIGLLGQAEEHLADIGDCDHAQGICGCRLQERIREAQAALAQTKQTHETKT